jgi:hypothetical protein
MKPLILLSGAVCLLLFSCGDRSEQSASGAKANSDTSLAGIDTADLDFDNDISKYSNVAGIAGVYNVKPMLALCRMDSASLDTLAQRVSYTYGVLTREAERLRSEVLYAGQLSYNNDPENFKFECVYLIKNVPGRRSDSAKAVLLEPASMLMFNHYGTYGSLYQSYEKIRNYCKESNLSVAGAMREFYITDPVTERDTSRWLTKIMVPVAQKK